MNHVFQALKRALTARQCLLTAAGSAVLAFGLCNIHAYSNVTEGGVLGMTLLLQHWLGWSPAATSLVLNGACYVLGWRTLGKRFLLYSLLGSGLFSLFYALFEPFAPLFPALLSSPLLCALVGALFVGVGAGLCVRAGGAPSGDDALAMSLSRVTRAKIENVYLISDLVVLAMSASYIPLPRLAYSLLTVILSGRIIGWMQPRKR